MRVAVLASGSKGNCVYIETLKHHILVDIGMTSSKIEEKLIEIKVSPKDIDSIFITHAHKDHTSGLNVFYKKYKPNVYLTDNIYKEANLNLASYNVLKEPIIIDDLIVTPIKTSHDAEDSRAYIFESNNKSVVYMTDTGYINSKYFDLLTNRNLYIMESNHDIEMLMNNPHYPHYLKMRILGEIGHLSNIDSAKYLTKFIGKDTKKVILHHLSEENNTKQLAVDTLEKALNSKKILFNNIIVAEQNEVSEVIEI